MTELEKEKKFKISDLFYFASYMLEYKWQLLFASIALVISTILGMFFPSIISLMVDHSVVRASNTPTVNSFLNKWLPVDINSLAVFLIIVLMIQGLLSYIQSFFFVKIGGQTVVEIRKKLYSHSIELPMTFFLKTRTGDLLNRLSSDLAQIEDVLTSGLSNIVREGMLLLFSVILIVYTSPELSLVMLSVVPAVIGLTIWVGRKVRSHTKDAQSQLARSTVLADESLQGIQTVKAYSSEIFEKNRYNSSLISFLRIFIKRAQVRALLVSTIMAGLFSAIVIVLWYGMTLVQTGALTLGELTAFVIYTVFAGGAASVVSDVYSQFQKAAGIGERITEIFQKEKENLGDTTSWGGLKINGEVEFENVSFNYPTRHNITVLNNISFKVRRGERVALVGPSGSGKTTITALLFRFFDATKGRILIDGKNINDYPLAMFRKECAIVQQDVYLFGRTIYENIVYGKPNATREDVIAAAKQANAHEFISRIPEQYNALVGERGILLSGGQKQRIAIARAILRNPKILILDEATSALDSESEKQVQVALELLMENRTSIIISHRLSTIRTADNILVLDHGNVIEQGTHNELNEKQDGIYRNLSYLQTS